MKFTIKSCAMLTIAMCLTIVSSTFAGTTWFSWAHLLLQNQTPKTVTYFITTDKGTFAKTVNKNEQQKVFAKDQRNFQCLKAIELKVDGNSVYNLNFRPNQQICFLPPPKDPSGNKRNAYRLIAKYDKKKNTYDLKMAERADDESGPGETILKGVTTPGREIRQLID